MRRSISPKSWVETASPSPPPDPLRGAEAAGRGAPRPPARYVTAMDVADPPSADPSFDRAAGAAMLRGARGRCPRCGDGALMRGYLDVADACPACGEAFHHHRADDAPAWATMLVVGHAMVPLILAARAIAEAPTWLHMVVWPLAALAMCLALLPRIKGAIVAFQWARRMHGFGEG